MKFTRPILKAAAFVFLAFPASADPAIVKDVDARKEGTSWRFSVTLAHADTGWDDYADGWRIVAEDGNVLGTRILAHPHVNEQPFTRSLSGVSIPDDVGTIFIETSTNTQGWDDVRYPVVLK